MLFPRTIGMSSQVVFMSINGEKTHVKSYTLFALWLPQHFAFCSFWKRNTQPRAVSWHLLCPSTQSSHINTHIKDFKPSNIQDSNEELSWQLCVQGLVDTDHQPFEHSIVHCLRQGPNSIQNLKYTVGETNHRGTQRFWCNRLFQCLFTV